MSGSLAGRWVLVVDDNPASRAVLAGQLASWGMCPSTVASGEQALAALAVPADPRQPA